MEITHSQSTRGSRWVEIDLDHLLDMERETNSANGIWLWREYWTNKSRTVNSYKLTVDWGNNNAGCLFQRNWNILDPLRTENFPKSGSRCWVDNLYPHCEIWNHSGNQDIILWLPLLTPWIYWLVNLLVSVWFPVYTFLDATDFYHPILWMPIWFPALCPIPMYSNFQEAMSPHSYQLKFIHLA